MHASLRRVLTVVAQDEARRALKEMFKGKDDSLSMYDPAPGGGGNGRKGNGGKVCNKYQLIDLILAQLILMLLGK